MKIVRTVRQRIELPVIENLETRLMLDASPLGLQVVGAWGGTASDVVVVSGRAYVCRGLGLDILNVSDPSHPSRSGSIRLPEPGKRVYVSGNRAYVADGSSGLQIIDVSDPTGPQSLGRYDTSGTANAVLVIDNIAYVADGSAGIQVLDISDPSSPKLLGTYDTPSNAYDLVISGSIAYVADGMGMQVIDVSDPSTPLPLCRYSPTSFFNGICISGNSVYLVGKTYSFSIVDISNPAAPRPIGGYSSSTLYQDIAVSGSLAYVTGLTSGQITPRLIVFDISSPLAVVSKGTIVLDGLNGDPKNVFLSGQTVYVADGTEGLQIVDVANAASPVKVGTYNPFCTDAGAVFLAGDLAYVADGYSGLQIIDVQDPARPMRLGGCYAGMARDVFVSGNVAYVAGVTHGLEIIDVTNPSAPTLIKEFATVGWCEDIFIVGDLAYIADYTGGLIILDVSNPAAPVRLGCFGFGKSFFKVVVSGNRAYVADLSAGLYIIDVSNPAAPTKVGYCNTGTNVAGIAVCGDLIYVGAGSSGLKLIDVSNLQAPAIIWSYDTAGSASGIVKKDDLIYVADDFAGIQIIDVSNPAVPFRVGGCVTHTACYDLWVAGDTIHSVSWGNGLVTLREDNSPTDIVLSCDSIQENSPAGASVGLFGTADPDIDDQFAYSLVAGTGADDNVQFEIKDNVLKTQAVFDHESGNAYSIRVRSTDSGGLFVERIFIISVADVNELPAINNQTFNVTEHSPNGTVIGNVAASDPDLGQSLAYTIESGNTGGAFVIDPATSQITVNNAAAVDFEATPSFLLVVRVTDNGAPALWQSAVVTINLADMNDAPVITAPGLQIMNQSTALVFSQSSGNAISIADHDAAGGAERVTITSTGNTLTLVATDGLISLSGNGTQTVTFSGTIDSLNAALEGLTLRCDEALPGSAVIWITTDDQGNSGAGGPQIAGETVFVTINAVNHAPTFVSGPDQIVDEDAAEQYVENWATLISAGPHDPFQGLTFLTSNDNNALFAEQPIVTVDGTLRYKPADNASGTATITVLLRDDGGTSNGGVDTSLPQAFTITVNPVNDTPTAAAQVARVGDDAGVTIALSGSDLETPASELVYSISTWPAHGTVTSLGGNLFRYEVGRGYEVSDSFTFTVTDGDRTSAPARVDIGGGLMKAFDAKGMVSFIGSNLAIGTIKVKAGTGSVFFGHEGNCDIGRIFLDQTTPKSSMTISVKYRGMTAIVLGGIDCAGPLSKLSAASTWLSGQIQIGAGTTVSSVTLGQALGASVISGSAIKTLSATTWSRKTDASAMILAPSLARLSIKGDFAGDLNVDSLGRGSIGGSMVGSRIQVGGATGKFAIKGDMLASSWNVLGDMGKFALTGTADSSVLRSGGSMSGVSVGATCGSDFLAGIAGDCQRHAEQRTDDHNDFVNTTAAIKSFAIKGLKRMLPSQVCFSDSNLSAANLGAISLLNGDSGIGSNGIYYASSGTVRKIQYLDKCNRANNWAWPPRPGIVFSQPDVIHVI